MDGVDAAAASAACDSVPIWDVSLSDDSSKVVLLSRDAEVTPEDQRGDESGDKRSIVQDSSH